MKVFASMVFRWMVLFPPMDVFLVGLVLCVKHGAHFLFLFYFCLVRLAVGQHPKWLVLSDVIDSVMCRFWIIQYARV